MKRKDALRKLTAAIEAGQPWERHENTTGGPDVEVSRDLINLCGGEPDENWNKGSLAVVALEALAKDGFADESPESEVLIFSPNIHFKISKLNISATAFFHDGKIWIGKVDFR